LTSARDRAGYLWIDLVLFAERCNLSCAYCRGWPSDRAAGTPTLPSSASEAERMASLRSALGELLRIVSAPILKLSGGELFTTQAADSLIDWACERMPVVQVLTNGVRLDEGGRLERLADAGNVHLQISLDGHTTALNSARTDRAPVHGRIVRALQKAVRLGLPIEINCVITSRNAAGLEQFSSFLTGLGAKEGQLTLFPRPVRNQPARLLGPRTEDHGAFERFLSRCDRYRQVLPPLSYLERVLEMMRLGRRRSCMIPYFVLGLEEGGKVRSCTVGDMPTIGTLADEQCRIAVVNKSHYSPNAKYSDCRDCINQYEMACLFVDGEVPLPEMQRMMLFRNPKVSEALVAISRDVRTADTEDTLTSA
jgi:MoaA/NifB/PqqE/SkfB family radical SAM enzyme